MSKRCVCGVCFTLPNVFGFDCKHIFCQDCARVWAMATACPRCHIEDTLDPLTVSGVNENILDDLTQFFCLRIRELSAEKQNTLLLESFSTTSQRNSNSTHDDVLRQYPGNENGGSATGKANKAGGQERMAGDDINTLVDGDDEQTLDSSSNWRKRQKTAATDEADCTLTISVDKERERVLLRKTEELKLQLDKAHTDLESREKAYKDRLEVMKQRVGDMAKKTKDISSASSREARRQADKIKGLVSDLDGQYVQFTAAKKTIQELKSKTDDDKLALRKAEKRAADFEAWGRQTKTHYQEIIKQMEAIQPRSESTVRSPSQIREYSKELPTLRHVRPLYDLDGDEEILFTPKKKRESAPIIMTPFRQSSSSYVDLTRSGLPPPKLEFD